MGAHNSALSVQTAKNEALDSATAAVALAETNLKAAADAKEIAMNNRNDAVKQEKEWNDEAKDDYDAAQKVADAALQVAKDTEQEARKQKKEADDAVAANEAEAHLEAMRQKLTEAREAAEKSARAKADADAALIIAVDTFDKAVAVEDTKSKL